MVLWPGVVFGQGTIKITSPASNSVFRPGQTIDVEVAVTGRFSVVRVSDPSPTVDIPLHKLESPPYRCDLTAPTKRPPGKYMIAASLYAPTNAAVASDTVWIDVEREDSPREIRIGAPSTTLQIGSGTDLTVTGIYADNDRVDLTRSTRTTYTSDPTGIVSVSKEGQVVALTPGFVRLLVHHDALEARVNMSVSGANLEITRPVDGTVVHPGETIVVEVKASGGPFEFVMPFSWDLAGGEMLINEPYRFSLTVPTPRKPGPTNLVAIGKVGPLQVFSAPVSVDIERSDVPEMIWVDRSVVGTERLRVGQQGQIPVYGKFPDNSVVPLTGSSLITYEADTTGIVSISKDGYTIGVAGGSTNVTVRYGELQTVVKITVR